jgi:hypothetical protein
MTGLSNDSVGRGAACAVLDEKRGFKTPAEPRIFNAGIGSDMARF